MGRGNRGGGSGRGDASGGGRGGRGRGRGDSSGAGRGGGRGGGGRGFSNPPPAPVAPAPARPAVSPVMPPSAAAPPAVATSTSVGQLGTDLEEKASISTPTLVTPSVATHFPSRPGFGTVGRKLSVYANHFRVQYSSSSDVYHYDVSMAMSGQEFTNDGLPKTLANKVMELLLREMKRQFPQHCLVSDSRKNIYAPKRLPFSVQRFDQLKLVEDGKERLYDCMVKEADPVAVRMSQLDALFAGRLNYTPYDAIQALDIAIRHTASQRFISVGRSLYSSSGAQSIGEGADVWFGYFQSLRATQNRLVVNLDLAATAFVRASDCLEFMMEALELRDMPRSLNKFQYARLNKMIKGVKVQITHRPGVKRAYRVNGLSPYSADETYFEDDNGKKMSIVQYFQSAYKMRLRYPGLPCLHVGAVNRKVYLPIEVCRIMEGQKTPRKVTEKQVANMIRYTATKPDIRKRRIEEKLSQAGFAGDSVLGAFGLKVDPNMVTTNARQLRAPEMLYAKNAVERPNGGAWNMRNKSFYDARGFKSWAIISMCDPRRCSVQDLEKFFKAVINQAGQLGMRTPTGRPPMVTKQGRNDSVRSLFMSAVNEAERTFGAKPDIVWMVNPVSDAHAYGELKRVSDTEYGIVSQCMLAKHLQKCSPQYIANILLKVNAKLGGKNTVVRGPLPKFSQVPTIVFGADVTHPAPMDKTRPSIAAVVASMDPNCIKHAAAIRAQGHRVEQIENLKEMTVELLKSFYMENRGLKPARIIFYRDGVSEGQFHMVLNYEVTAIREACASLEKGYCPPITFVVVQKRHNTRLFVTNRNDADRSGNVPAGTVIDNGICHPVENDFYLMSHSGIQGTSRPTHYHVLLDEIGFTADELQMLTYTLCYTFARCTRSVSIVPAAYYSHLVAARARYFSLDGSDTASNVSGRSAQDVTDLRMLDVHANLKRVMFYV